jgi:hypothetical protein
MFVLVHCLNGNRQGIRLQGPGYILRNGPLQPTRPSARLVLRSAKTSVTADRLRFGIMNRSKVGIPSVMIKASDPTAIWSS